MNKLLGYIAVALLAFGVGYLVHPKNSAQQKGYGEIETNKYQFAGGLTAGTTNQFTVGTTGNVSTSGTLSVTGTTTLDKIITSNLGSSSSTPAALGSSSVGFFTATTTTQSASTTAVTANSAIFLQQVETVPTAGTTCTTARASTTIVSTQIAGNGFIIKFHPAPPGSATPYCYAYRINN